jgi:hypothetical protein
MNKLIKIGLASLMVFTIGCSSKKNDAQSESSTTTQQTENSSKKDGIQNDGEGKYKTTETGAKLYIEPNLTGVEITEENFRNFPETSKNYFTYEWDEYGNSYNITGCTSESRVVHVPSKINGRPVKMINPHALSELPNVEAIVLPDTVGSVREDALSNNPKLKYIEFGKSLFVLCEDSMLSLPSLEKVVLPESLEKIDAWVFSGENLKDIYLPSNVKKLSNLFCLSKSCSPDLKIHVKTGSVTAENIKNSDLVTENKVVFE